MTLAKLQPQPHLLTLNGMIQHGYVEPRVLAAIVQRIVDLSGDEHLKALVEEDMS